MSTLGVKENTGYSYSCRGMATPELPQRRRERESQVGWDVCICRSYNGPGRIAFREGVDRVPDLRDFGPTGRFAGPRGPVLRSSLWLHPARTTLIYTLISYVLTQP